MNKQAYKLSLLGSTDQQLADFLEVEVSTINKWKLDHPKFSESIKAGKEEADATIASSLYHRAKGYSHPDVDIRTVNGEIIKTKLTKHYPPDSTAIIFWLKNRQKARWRDRIEQDLTSNGETIGTVIDANAATQYSDYLKQQTAS